MEQLVDVQLRRVDTPGHHGTVAVQSLVHYIRVNVVDLGPVIEIGFILPPIAEGIDKLHIEARVVGAFGEVVVRSAAIVHTFKLRWHNVRREGRGKLSWNYSWIGRMSKAWHHCWESTWGDGG